MLHHQFAENVVNILKDDSTVIGLAAGGSWLTNELDEYSDLDLVLVTQQKISGLENMLACARRFGNLLNGFTGEHVGEPALLICLYEDPLLHVDIKFITLEEFGNRIETPVILLDKNKQLQQCLDNSQAKFPYPDYQWMEDRFWTWIHYALLKTGRGEYFEAIDFLAFLRTTVLGPLLHIKNGNLPRGVRKVEMQISSTDLDALKLTLPTYDRTSLLNALSNSVQLYRDLRAVLFDKSILIQFRTEKKVMEFLEEIRK